MTLNKNFQKRIDKLQTQLLQLKKSKSITRTDLSSVPKRGIYLFIENKKYIYVGRTNRMRARLLEHGRESAGHNDASFAFKLAKIQAEKIGIDIRQKRNDLVKIKQFDKLFKEARQRVAKMDIKFIEIVDPIDQYLFEVYASEVLKTPFNDFENH